MMLDGTAGSLQATLNTLEIFGNYSGLKMNKDKTRVLWIGRKKHSKDKLVTTPMLICDDFDLLGITFSLDLETMLQKNYCKCIEDIKNTINHWKRRYLTPMGKITVIKTFIISKFTHLFHHFQIQPVIFWMK